MINRKKFYDCVRDKPFNGYLTQHQVDGINYILDTWESHPEFTDMRWLAYMLGTTKWETASTMVPVEEYGHGAGRTYGKPDSVTGQTYFGRGYVQLTWKSNYQKMSALLGIDLVNDPSKALDPKIAASIMFIGMRDGIFTGFGLPMFFNEYNQDWTLARKIVNDMDHATDIASMSVDFWRGLT